MVRYIALDRLTWNNPCAKPVAAGILLAK